MGLWYTPLWTSLQAALKSDVHVKEGNGISMVYPILSLLTLFAMYVKPQRHWRCEIS